MHHNSLVLFINNHLIVIPVFALHVNLLCKCIRAQKHECISHLTSHSAVEDLLHLPSNWCSDLKFLHPQEPLAIQQYDIFISYILCSLPGGF